MSIVNHIHMYTCSYSTENGRRQKRRSRRRKGSKVREGEKSRPDALTLAGWIYGPVLFVATLPLVAAAAAAAQERQRRRKRDSSSAAGEKGKEKKQSRAKRRHLSEKHPNLMT